MPMTHREYYEKANLQDNPFRPNTTADADPRRGIWVGYPKERAQLMKLLSRSRSDQIGNINFGLVYGDYGTGKSHALMWAHYQVTQAQADDFKCLAYYIPTLLKDKAKLSFGTAFNEDIVQRSSLVRDVTVYRQFLDEQIVTYKRDNGIDASVPKEAVLEKILPSMELVNLAKEVLASSDEASVRQLLFPKGDHEAMLLFTRIANLFTHCFENSTGDIRFKQGIYLFIDEIDELANVSAKEAREQNAMLRHIYDQCPTCFCLILGFTATAADLNILFDEYVLSRVTRQVVLDYLQPDEAKEFVAAILDNSRLDDNSNTGCYPFTEDAIESAVAQVVSITPRKIVNMMMQVLEECRLADLDPTVSPISAQMLDDSGIWDEIA